MAHLPRGPRSALLALTLALGLGAQDAALRDRIALALDTVPAIDHHAHLLEVVAYEPGLDPTVPPLMRSTNPVLVWALNARFGIAWDPTRGTELQAQGLAARQTEVLRLGGLPAYWADHLKRAHLELVLVNQLTPDGTNGTTLRWVPTASPLLLPLPAQSLEARNPLSKLELGQFRTALQTWIQADAGHRPLASLSDYLTFMDRQLSQWQHQGAVALKFVEAYHRTLDFEAVSTARAEALWRRGQAHPLSRTDYLALQSFLARHLFREAGKRNLPVHLHTGLGGSSRIRLQEADPRNLESILTDPAFGGTEFVLIHAGNPDTGPAAWMAAFKPNLWLDLSGLAFYLPPEELSAAVRTCLLFAPERTLFGTDAFGGFQIPVGPEITQLGYGEALRQSLYDALASLVAQGVLDEAGALHLGGNVLRGNARRLYRWERASPQAP